jgi:hypothetical protein
LLVFPITLVLGTRYEHYVTFAIPYKYTACMHVSCYFTILDQYACLSSKSTFTRNSYVKAKVARPHLNLVCSGSCFADRCDSQPILPRPTTHLQYILIRPSFVTTTRYMRIVHWSVSGVISVSIANTSSDAFGAMVS